MQARPVCTLKCIAAKQGTVKQCQHIRVQPHVLIHTLSHACKRTQPHAAHMHMQMHNCGLVYTCAISLYEDEHIYTHKSNMQMLQMQMHILLAHAYARAPALAHARVYLQMLPLTQTPTCTYNINTYI